MYEIKYAISSKKNCHYVSKYKSKIHQVYDIFYVIITIVMKWICNSLSMVFYKKKYENA